MCAEGPRRILDRAVTRSYRPIIATAVITAAVAAHVAFAQSHPKPSGTGVVVINTNLAYEGGQAAGTGMVLTSSGEILTNNHVIRGATSIRIVVPGTGKRYTATVVGYNVKDDVAVLQATGASNLKTVSLGDSSKLKVGQSVTAFGNAGGTGRLTSVSGKVVSRSRTITVSDDQGGSERLTRLIETSARLQPGDSGGPLETTGGKVIAMDTAASVSGGFVQTVAGDGFAIPINRALTIAKNIESGKTSATVHIGGTAFLGVTLGPGQGALIEGILRGGAAEAAGLTAGDVITNVDGHAISSANALSSLLLTKHPGDRISVTFSDQFGTSQTVTATLDGGPPQ